MAPAPKGEVLERKWKSGRGYALRFHANGRRHYLTLGMRADGWTRRRAEDELQNVLADVRRGIWIAPDRRRDTGEAGEAQAAAQAHEPTFHEFASWWLAGRHGEISPRSVEHYEWALTYHLLPYFAHHRLPEIDIEAVDAYRRHKVNGADARRANGQRPLAAVTINKTIDVLQAILALAVEYGHIASNPAAGKRRRLKPLARRPVHLDSAQHIHALLEAAGHLDARPGAQTSGRRALIATLVLAGPRASEAASLLWRDVDLANGRLYIGRSKTAAGLREIPLLPLLRDELGAHKARCSSTGPDDPVFPSASGRARDKDNVRNRVVQPAVRRAGDLLAQRHAEPLPQGLTPHKLRHTFASVLVACGEDPASVMSQLGHADPKFTLRVYAHLMRRGPAERQQLRELVYGAPRIEPERDRRDGSISGRPARLT
ncbi:MAG: integrase [Solirubrobacteraceae bacterium]|jgi:integrase|nr:integrase [Solirubrobacteraceae bacterium]